MVAIRAKSLTDPTPVWQRPGVTALARLAAAGDLTAAALAHALARDVAATPAEARELEAYLHGVSVGAELARAATPTDN